METECGHRVLILLRTHGTLLPSYLSHVLRIHLSEIKKGNVMFSTPPFDLRASQIFLKPNTPRGGQ